MEKKTYKPTPLNNWDLLEEILFNHIDMQIDRLLDNQIYDHLIDAYDEYKEDLDILKELLTISELFDRWRRR